MLVNDSRVAALRHLAREAELALRVAGGCMEPLLPEGSRVALDPVRLPWPGDVVAFGAPGRLLLHRVIGYRPRRFSLELVTRGDRAPSPDAPVPLRLLVGRARVRVSSADRLRALARFTELLGTRLLARFLPA